MDRHATRVSHFFKESSHISGQVALRTKIQKTKDNNTCMNKGEKMDNCMGVFLFQHKLHTMAVNQLPT